MKPVRDRWWDRSCRIPLYSKMAVQAHAGCTISQIDGPHGRTVFKRVPEGRHGSSLPGAVGRWRRTYRRRMARA